MSLLVKKVIILIWSRKFGVLNTSGLFALFYYFYSSWPFRVISLVFANRARVLLAIGDKVALRTISRFMHKDVRLTEQSVVEWIACPWYSIL